MLLCSSWAALAQDSFTMSDCEDGNKTKYGSYWFSFNDNANGGKSIVTPDPTAPAFTMTKGGANGTDSAAMISYTLGKGTLSYDPFVGFGFSLDTTKNPLTKKEIARDLSNYTGISFWHKGDAHILEIALDTITDDCNFNVNVAQHTEWTLVVLPWKKFKQYTWGKARTWDAARITKFQWKQQKSSGTGEIWIDEIQLISINKSELEAAVKLAEDSIKTAIEGADFWQYPAGSKAELQSVVDQANAIIASATAKQPAIDSSLAVVKTAFSKFIELKKIPYTLISSNENGNKTALNTFWFTYNDNANGGSSTITPNTEAGEFTMSLGGASNVFDSASNSYVTNPETYCAAVSYKLNKGSLSYDPFVGLGFPLNVADNIPYDLSNSLGVMFYFKGESVNFNVALSTITDGDNFFVTIPKKTNWTLIKILWSDLKQNEGWGKDVAWDASKITKFQWQKSGVNNLTAKTFSIDEVQIVGKILDMTTATAGDRTALNAAIATAKTDTLSIKEIAVDTILVAGEYRKGTLNAYKAAIANVEKVSADTSASVAQIAGASAALADAIEAKNNALIPDFAPLKTSIASAKALVSNATEGLKNGQYAKDSKAKLQTAISNAEVVLNDSASVTSTQVAGAVSSLSTAVAEFNKAKVIVNTDNLNASIAEAEELIEAAVEGTKPGEYGVGSIDLLSDAIETAKAVASKDSLTQSEVNTAKIDIDNAITAFENAQVPTGIRKSSVTFVLAPVPVVDELKVITSSEVASVKVYNASKVLVAQSASKTVQMATLPSGTYAAVVELVNGEVITGTIVK